MGNNYVNNYGGYNIINQNNSTANPVSKRKELSQFGIEVKKEVPFSLKIISEVLGLVASVLSIVQLTGLNEGLVGLGTFWFTTFSEMDQNIWVIVALIALFMVTIFLGMMVKQNFKLLCNQNEGHRFRDSENHNTYALRKRKCPLCGRKSRLLVKRLNASEFMFSCTKCRNKVIASFDDIFNYAEEMLLCKKQTDKKKD